jgi:hypothetical protein
LRFERYQQRLKNSISLIKDYIREQKERALSAPTMEDSVQRESSPSIYDQESERLAKIKKKEKKLLTLLIKSDGKNRDKIEKWEKKAERKKKVQKGYSEVASNALNKTTEYFNKHKERMKDLVLQDKEVRQKMEERLQDHLSRSPKKRTSISPDFRETFTAKRQKANLNKEMQERSIEEERVKVAEQVDEKLHRSHMRYQENLRNRIERVASKRARVDSYVQTLDQLREEDEICRLNKIVQKTQMIDSKKEQLIKELEAKKEKYRQQFQEKSDKFLSNIERVNKDQEEKMKTTEKRIHHSMDFHKKKQDEFYRDNSFKREMSRIKDDDFLYKHKRVKRLQQAQKEKFLNKFIEKVNRVENLKMEKEMLVMQRRDNNIRAMLDRIKAQDTIQKILKEKNPRDAHKTLKQIYNPANASV